MSRRIQLSPSILSADFSDLRKELKAAEAGQADWVHIDVMDGHFVPNITVGPFVVEAIKRTTRLPLDVHLMIENPLRYAEAFAKAGADVLTVHLEACPNLKEAIAAIRRFGARPGVSLKPKSSLESLLPHLDHIDWVLLMTVEPGFSGQEFMEEVLPKVSRLRQTAPNIDIEVDGGINQETAPRAVAAGANVLVAGHAIYHSQNSATALLELRKVALKARDESRRR